MGSGWRRASEDAQGSCSSILHMRAPTPCALDSRPRPPFLSPLLRSFSQVPRLTSPSRVGDHGRARLQGHRHEREGWTSRSRVLFPPLRRRYDRRRIPHHVESQLNSCFCSPRRPERRERSIGGQPDGGRARRRHPRPACLLGRRPGPRAGSWRGRSDRPHVEDQPGREAPAQGQWWERWRRRSRRERPVRRARATWQGRDKAPRR